MKYDFRSDTVTRPTSAMRDAMRLAEVGDDVFGDDPTVSALERTVAERFGKAEGLFMPSGTQSNLVALMTHCGRGDEYIAGQDAHCYRYEAGGAAVLGGIQPQPLSNQPDGSLALEDIAAAVKPDDFHYARTRLLALENTIGGKVLPEAYVTAATDLARRFGLATHLDGARVFNAAVASNRSVADLAAPFDTVSVCLSKGLGAPVGSVLIGSAALIAKARRLRKMLGGGMRQAGVLAAAGLYALDHHVERLAEDHANARLLAEGLSAFPGLAVTAPDTNIVFVDLAPEIATGFSDFLTQQGIGVVSFSGGRRQRWVTHLDIDNASVQAALSTCAKYFA